MTEEVPCERSRVSGRNSSNVEEELSRNFQIPRLGAEQPPLHNPRVNYRSNGSSEKKGKKRSFTWKGKSAKESPHGISSKELVVFPATNVDEVPRFGKKRKLQEMGLIVDGFHLDKNWDESQLKLKVPKDFFEKVFSNRDSIRKAREAFIQKAKTIDPDGLNIREETY